MILNNLKMNLKCRCKVIEWMYLLIGYGGDIFVVGTFLVAKDLKKIKNQMKERIFFWFFCFWNGFFDTCKKLKKKIVKLEVVAKNLIEAHVHNKSQHKYNNSNNQPSLISFKTFYFQTTPSPIFNNNGKTTNPYRYINRRTYKWHNITHPTSITSPIHHGERHFWDARQLPRWHDVSLSHENCGISQTKLQIFHFLLLQQLHRRKKRRRIQSTDSKPKQKK